MDTTACPYCGGDVPIDAVKCRHCTEWLTDKRPRGAREPPVTAKGLGEAAVKEVAFFVVAVFVLAVLSGIVGGGR